MTDTQVQAQVLFEHADHCFILIGAPYSVLVMYAELESFSIDFAGHNFLECRFTEPLDHAVLIDNLFYARCRCLAEP